MCRYAAVSASPHVSKSETVMPTYGVALLVLVFAGTFVVGGYTAVGFS